MSLKASAVLLPLLGLTWILGFLAVDTGHSKVMMYIFNYLFTITNSFQVTYENNCPFLSSTISCLVGIYQCMVV